MTFIQKYNHCALALVLGLSPAFVTSSMQFVTFSAAHNLHYHWTQFNLFPSSSFSSFQYWYCARIYVLCFTIVVSVHFSGTYIHVFSCELFVKPTICHLIKNGHVADVSPHSCKNWPLSSYHLPDYNSKTEHITGIRVVATCSHQVRKYIQ